MTGRRARAARPVKVIVRELVPPERLNMLVDAVYAIIMTLLVLELKLPEGLSPAEGLNYLRGLEPKIAAFMVGFIVTGSGWAYVHQASAMFARSNLVHLGLNLLALLVASLVPFSASIMGAFPDQSYGPAAYSLNIGVLTLIYAADLAICQRWLIPPVVSRGLIWTIVGLATAAGLWCLFAGLVIAPWMPRVGMLCLALHAVMHWGALFLTEGPMSDAARTAERWHETAGDHG